MIAGPTATGKSEVAVAVAKEVGGEIINADSVQVYKYCDIGTAKPSAQQRREVPHYLYDILEPDQEFNAGEYENLAERIALSIYKKGKLPIVVGGTGLYIKALLWGLSIPAPKDPALREELKEEMNRVGSKVMHKRLEEIDPITASRLSPQDGVRIVRALEIFRLTGTPPSQFSSWQPKPWIEAITVALDMPKERLRRRIDQRTEKMVKEGLVEETQQILSMGYPESSPPLKAIGYKQVIEYLDGKLSLLEMVEEIKKATRRYAKRQRTWFRKEGFTWIDSENPEQAVEKVLNLLKKSPINR